MSETVSQVAPTPRDITRDVVEFFALRGLDREPYAIHIPSLFLVARNGLLSVTQHVQTFDGCHPYEYDATERAEQFAIHALRTQAYGILGSKGVIDLGRVGDLRFGSDEFGKYRFVVEGEEVVSRSDQELALEQYLATTKGLSNVTPEQLVRYDQTLHVSTVDPFRNPITIPQTTPYGTATALHNIPVAALSTATTDLGKVIALTVQESRISLAPVPLSDIRFSIHDVEHTPKWLANMIPQLLRKGDADEAQRLLDEWSQSVPEGGLPYFVDRNPRDPSMSIQVVTGKLEGGAVCDLTLSSMLRPSFRENGWTTQIVIDDKTQQAFAIDRETGIAVSMHQIEVRGPKGY